MPVAAISGAMRGRGLRQLQPCGICPLRMRMRLLIPIRWIPIWKMMRSQPNRRILSLLNCRPGWPMLRPIFPRKLRLSGVRKNAPGCGYS
ncbi:MAG: hypothetical protein ACK55Z_24035, partial [bacterium]